MLFAMARKVNRFPVLSIFLAATALFLVSCSWLPGRGFKSCKYRFQTLSFLGMDSQATHWHMDVAVINPNAKEVSLTRMRYALLYQADTLLSGWNPEKRVLAAGDSQVIRTTLDLPNAVFKRLPPALWSQTDAQFTLVADAYLNTWIGDINVPQAIKETVHINMTEQVAKYRDMVLKRFFGGWPGDRLKEGGIVAPDSSAPRPNQHF
jgi:Late embryogenesis abundant protein